MSWTYTTCRWPSREVWLAALAAQGWQDGAPPGVDLIVAGTLYGPLPDDQTPSEALPGWYVSAAFRAPAAPPDAWADLVIEPPEGMAVHRRPAPPTLADYQAAIEAHVEATARERGYSSAVSCASYVGSTVPAWAAEAAAFVVWRDQIWLEVFQALAAVQQGAAPPTIAGLIARFPAMEWPA